MVMTFPLMRFRKDFERGSIGVLNEWESDGVFPVDHRIFPVLVISLFGFDLELQAEINSQCLKVIKRHRITLLVQGAPAHWD